MLSRSLENRRHVLGEAQYLECLGDVVACDGLLSLLIRYLVRLGRDKGDELDTAFYEQVSSLLGVRDTIGLR